jgi:hypothetical protein
MMILGFWGIGFMTYRRRSGALRLALSGIAIGLQRDRLRAVFLFSADGTLLA